MFIWVLDSQRFYFDKEVFLGHVRLSILDLSSSADQPFEDKEAVLIFNGEIYNYLELYKEYILEVVLKTRSDTEVLFFLLKKFGKDIIPLLNGMFSFAFYNKKNKTILLARDMLGIKPLYYNLQHNFLEFSSEIKALDYKINLNKVKEFVVIRSYQNGYLPYDNINEFPVGHFAVYDLEKLKLEITKYKTVDDTPNKELYHSYSRLTINELSDKLDKLINESVEIHLRSEAKIGALCSGGVDSSLISAIANKINPDIPLYHAGIEDGPGGEEYYADMVAKHIGKRVNYIKMNEKLYWEKFSYITYISDLPIYHPNHISLFYISEKAKQDGIKVLLSGEGADELFGGYSFYKTLIKRKKFFDFYDKLYNTSPFLRKVLKRVFRFVFNYTKNALYDFNSNDYINFMPLGLGYSEINTELLVRSATFMANNFKNWKDWQRRKNIYQGFDEKEDNNFALACMLYSLYGHLGSILHRTDRILMANSIEGRVPFLENKIINFALNLPFKAKINKGQGKYLLKIVAERYLPYKVIYRPKVGFAVPWMNYIIKVEKVFKNGFLLDLFEMSFEELKSYYENDLYGKFCLISLEVWGRIFDRQEDYKLIDMLRNSV